MKNLKFLFYVIALEGLLAILWSILSPSDSQSLVFRFISRTKIALFLCLVIPWLVILFLGWYWRSRERLEQFFSAMDKFCLDPKRTVSLVIFFLVAPLFGLAIVLQINSIPPGSNAYESWAPVTFPMLYALAHRFLPFWIWVSISLVEIAIFLAIRYWPMLRKRETWAWNNSRTVMVVLLIACSTLFHWVVLAFQLRFFVNNPAWYWSIHPVPFTKTDIIFLLGILLLLAGLVWSLARNQNNHLISLLIIFVLGWFLQIGIGYISGDGFTSLRERYFSTYHRIYPMFASENNASILETIREYETRYGDRMFTNTKPPGLLAFYSGLERLANGNGSGFTTQQRYEKLSWAITFIFPILAMLNVFLVFSFTKKILGDSSGLVPLVSAFLYVLCPNIILFSLFADQAIYPILFLAGVILIVFVTRKGSILWAGLLGLLLYLAVFFAFTMLPLYVFTVVYFLLDYWPNKKTRSFVTLIKMIFGFAFGTILLYLIFLIFLNYNFVPRLQEAVQINHNFDFYTRVGLQPPGLPESPETRLNQIAGAAWLNNLDFAAAVGFPIYILALYQAIQIFIRTVTRRSSQADLVLAGLFSSFVILNLAGTAQGEVPRLWMFWVPLFVILAALTMKDLFKEKYAQATVFLAAAQVITVLLTFHFQDLHM